MQVLYTSPIFTTADGAARQFMIPSDAIKTYVKRDAALIAMKDMGGIYADLTPEFIKQRKIMMTAKRKIQREGWYCEVVTA
jgi:aspartokinase-like uncharacterized kinase